jgi:salicylate hydroxylase
MRVAIAGAGIAGLTAAIALAQRGIQVDLFERAAGLDEIGAGIQLAPNATSVLGRVGVMARLGAMTTEPEALSIRDARTGSLLSRMRLGRIARERYGAPYCTMLRADLQAALLATAQNEARIELSLGTEVRAGSDRPGVTIKAG